MGTGGRQGLQAPWVERSISRKRSWTSKGEGQWNEVSYCRKTKARPKAAAGTAELDPSLNLGALTEFWIGNTNSDNYLSVSEQNKKTPFQMFLEDDGPYSRKLYGPLKNTEDEVKNKPDERLFIKNFVFKSKDFHPLVRSDCIQL